MRQMKVGFSQNVLSELEPPNLLAKGCLICSAQEEASRQASKGTESQQDGVGKQERHTCVQTDCSREEIRKQAKSKST